VFSVCVFIDDPSRLNDTEQTLIIRYKSDFPRYGYNTQSLPTGAGSKLSIEVRRKMSEAQKARFQDPEIRRKMSEVRKAQCQDPEYQRKMSEAAKAQWQDPEVRRKMSEAMRGKSHSLEARRKMSEARKAQWQDPEVRCKMLGAQQKARQQKSSSKERETSNAGSAY